MWLPTKETQLPVKQIDENMEASIWLTVAQRLKTQKIPKESKDLWTSMSIHFNASHARCQQESDWKGWHVQAKPSKVEKKGDKHRNPSRNQEEPANHDGTEPLSWGKKEERRRETSTGTKEERRRETSTGTPAGTKRNQQIMMEQNPFPEERKKREEGRQAPEPKKREEGRQAPEPQPEPRGTSKSWWNRTPFLRKERREKKGDKHRNQRREKKGDKHRNRSRNQEEPANHDGTEPVSWGKKEERRRETSTGTPAGTRKTSKSWWNRTPFLRKERREKKGDKQRNPSRNQEEPANHDGTEPLS